MANKQTFLREQSGSVYIEFTVLAGLFFTLLFGIVEFSYVMWQWNAATKAVEAGVRLAVVSDPGPSALATKLVPGADAGSRISATSYSYTCLGDGQGGCNVQAMTRIVGRMQQFLPGLSPAEVQVRYSANGLAVIGSKGGLVPTVEVRIINKKIPTIMIGFLGINEIALPVASQAMIGEDLKSSYP